MGMNVFQHQDKKMDTRYLYINTIGCQMNVYDSERIEAALLTDGHALTESPDLADIVIVNTCSIREKAEQKAFSFIGRLPGLKRTKPGLIIAVGGCVAQQEGQLILERFPFVDLVFGTHAIGRVPALIERIRRGGARLVDIDFESGISEPEKHHLPQARKSLSKFVTIMRGCENFCTYCVVPFVRGREVSRDPKAIIAEIRTLVDNGVREVTLLGQNVNSYGKKERHCSFAELLAMVDRINGLLRIRFTTSHPKDLSTELIHAFGALNKLCHHIHLPVQSGSDRVLRRMNRKYSIANYLKQIDHLRVTCPDIGISTDFIVGFPGESKEDFEKTLRLVRRVEFDSLFAFKYSDRPNVPAAGFDDKLAENVKAERLKQLLELQEDSARKKNSTLIGTCQEVLVEGLSKKKVSDAPGEFGAATQWSGRTGTNKIVNFEWDDASGGFEELTGKVVEIEITKVHANSLHGRIQKKKSREINACKGEKVYAA